MNEKTREVHGIVDDDTNDLNAFDNMMKAVELETTNKNEIQIEPVNIDLFLSIRNTNHSTANFTIMTVNSVRI